MCFYGRCDKPNVCLCSAFLLISKIPEVAKICFKYSNKILTASLKLNVLLAPPKLRRSYAIRSVSSVSHSVCVLPYCKSNQPMSLKLAIMIGPTNRKNRLTFGGDPFPDTDFGLLFLFPHHCEKGNQSLIIILGAIRQTSVSGYVLIRNRISDHFCLKFWPRLRFALSEPSLVIIIISSKCGLI